MNKTVGLQLIVYSLLLAALSCLAYRLAPGQGLTTLVAGLAGGALCLAWGVRAALGGTRKALAILTLVPVNFVMLSQAVTSWLGGVEGAQGRPGAAVVTVLLALSFVMLMRVAYAGVSLGMPAPSPANERQAKPRATGSPAQAHAAQRR